MKSEVPWKLRSFCVIIPMYNEEAGLESCVRQVCQVLSGLSYPSRLIAVNDGSRDRTGAMLDRLAEEFPCLLAVHHERNAGYGAALRTGVRAAAEMGYDYALFMDSDLTNDPADIPRFVALMAENYDFIKATRYSRGGRPSGVPLYRVLISRAGNAIARLLFGLPVRDCTNGFRAVRVTLLARMQLNERKFPIIMEELYWAKCLARTFAEIPVVLTDRGAGRRPTSFAYRPSVFWRYLKYPLKTFLGIKPALTVDAPREIR